MNALPHVRSEYNRENLGENSLFTSGSEPRIFRMLNAL